MGEANFYYFTCLNELLAIQNSVTYGVQLQLLSAETVIFWGI